MTAIERLRPQNALTVLEEEMDHFMDKFFDRRPAGISSDVPSPNLEMLDKNDEVVVKAEVPGLAKSNIQVAVDGDLLTIKGEKKKEQETKEENYYFSECAYGAFSRSVRLPVEVMADQISANLINGVWKSICPRPKTPSGVV